MSTVCWKPDPDRVRGSTASRFIAHVKSTSPFVHDFESLYQYSILEPEEFWSDIWDFFDVIGTPGETVLADRNRMPGARFFPQASLNFAENLLRFRDDRDAIVFRSEAGNKRSISYAELFILVARTADALRNTGIGTGDRVAGFMPNVPETIVAMLAVSSIGATWSSCSPDFGTNGVVDRLGQIEPKILFCTDSYQYNGKRHDCLARVAEIQQNIPSIEKVIVVPYLDSQASTGTLANAVTFDSFTDNDASDIEFERLPFDHPLYILYSSGTTGVPKCITHGAGGTLLQHIKELALHAGVEKSDRVFYFTTCGWMMWNWLASNLVLGATLVLYEGSPFYPSPEAMFDLLDETKISLFGTGAKMISSWEKAGVKPRETHNLSTLRAMFSTGSVLTPENFDYVYRDVKPDIRLSSIAGGTDIISCFVGGSPLLPVIRGEIQGAGLAMKIAVLRDDGSEAEIDEPGELCCTFPFPSMPVSFWGDEDGSRYFNAYFAQFPNIWAHGDFIKKTVNGGYIIYGRSDATLNPGGVRIGTAEIYRQVETLDEIVESICIGQDWDDDVRVVLFVELREGLILDDELKNRICHSVRSNTTPRHVPAKIIQVNDIPRTVSGKIVELAVRNIVHGRAVKNVDALSNPEALDLYRNLEELQT